MTSAVVGQADTHCSHWMQSPKRLTRDLVPSSSSTSVGQTVMHASQPVQRSSLMLWMSSLRLAFCRRFDCMRFFSPVTAAETSTQNIANPRRPLKTIRGTMAADHYKSDAGGGASDSAGLALTYWGLDSLLGRVSPGSDVGRSAQRVIFSWAAADPAGSGGCATARRTTGPRCAR